MQNRGETPGSLIAEARQEAGLTQAELAAQVGTNQQTIGKIEKGITKNSPLIAPLFLRLGIPLEKLPHAQDGQTTPRHVLNQTQVRDVIVGKRDLPLYLFVEAGNGALVMSSDPVDRIERPDVLTFVKDAYAVTVVGDSMYPVLSPGNKVKVHPHTVPTPGELCLFIREENGEFHATIKRFVGQTKDTWRVKRYQPKEEIIALKKRDWPRCDVVVGVDYR